MTSFHGTIVGDDYFWVFLNKEGEDGCTFHNSKFGMIGNLSAFHEYFDNRIRFLKLKELEKIKYE